MNDDICLKCGRCCYYKLKSDVGDAFADKACQHLDKRTKLCKVYQERFTSGVGCLSTEEALKANLLPTDCPYAKDIVGYKGPMSFKRLKRILKNGER